jgi:predicted CXXCH cytochrome family protein
LVNRLSIKKEKTEKGLREEKGMKRLLGKTLAVTTLMVGLFAGTTFAFNGYNNDGDDTQQSRYNAMVPKHNSNLTGQSIGSGGLVKSVSGQKTHTDFKANTNSCASCHMTHTANAEALLFGSSTQDTCTSCHDGSLGFYNVKSGELYPQNSTKVTIKPGVPGLADTSTIVSSNAGSFDNTVKDASMHNVFTGKYLEVQAAPGGNFNGETGETGKWADEFTCASCHAPHGSYSERLLHYNPNGFGEVDIKNRGFGLTENPLIDTNADLTNSPEEITEAKLGYPVIDFATLAGYTYDYAVVKGLKADHVAEGADVSKATDGETVIMVYKKNSSADANGVPGYSPDTTPWLYAPGEYDSVAKAYPYTNMKFVKADKTTKINKGQTNVNYELGKGYVWGAGVVDAVYAKIARAAVVNLDLVEVGTFDQGIGGKNVKLFVTNNAATTGGALDANGTMKDWKADSKGVGIGLSKFCAACHVDYLASSGAPSGHYNFIQGKVTLANGTTDNLSCSACHDGVATLTAEQQTLRNDSPGSFRHSTNSDRFSCATCHMAHGTNQYFLKDATGKDYISLQSTQNPATLANYTAEEAVAHLDDVNPTSAIKRFTNMSVCWACHTSSAAESLTNNDEYQNAAVKQNGLANATWSDGNRWGFGKPAMTVAASQIAADNSAAAHLTSGSFLYDLVKREMYQAGNSNIKEVHMYFNSWNLVNKADAVTIVKDGTPLVAGTDFTFKYDLEEKDLVINFTNAITTVTGSVIDVTQTAPTQTVVMTIQGKTYTLKVFTGKFS